MSTTIFRHLRAIPTILKASRVHLSFRDRIVIDVRNGTKTDSAGNEDKLFIGKFGHRWLSVLSGLGGSEELAEFEMMKGVEFKYVDERLQRPQQTRSPNDP